jgi:hypothetical protein
MNSNDLKNELAQAGVDIGGRAVKGRLRAATRQAQKETDARYQTRQKESVTRRIQSMLALLAIFFVGGFLVVGNIANVVMFPISEFIAVRRGIMAFEAHGFIASFNASTIVIGYVVLLFVKNVLRDNLPGDVPSVFSFRGKRIVAEQLYISARWTILFLQVAIVLFGFLGRTSDTIIEGGPITIVETIGYTGTLVLTVALLAVTDITVLFIYSVFVNNVGLLDLTSGDRSAVTNFFEERQEALQSSVLGDLLIMAQAEQTKDLTE